MFSLAMMGFPPSLTPFWYLRLVMSMPLKMISPAVGFSIKFRERSRVDLPEPEGPMTTITSPLLMSTDTPSRALMTPRL